MSRFFDQTDMQVTDTAIKMPDGKVYKEGVTSVTASPVRSSWRCGSRR